MKHPNILELKTPFEFMSVSPDPTTSSTTPTKLSVVIIGKNEEDFIARSVGSALDASDQMSTNSEIIFVDSASTDRSIEVARQFPIRILQLKPDWPLCVAAGRYTGYRHSHGEYILFLDGDATVDSDWLGRAVKFLDDHPEYGAVAGVLDEQYLNGQGSDAELATNVFGQDLTKEVIPCKSLGGIAMYRRQAIEQAGTVNPHLPTGEDDELCMRIRNAGFKLARIQGRMALKYTEKRETLNEVLRRSRTKMYDYGAVIRYCSSYGRGLQYCFDAIPYVLSFSAISLLFLVAVPVAIYFQKVWILLAVAMLLLAAVAIKKRSIHLAFLSLATRAVSTYRTIASYLTTKPKPIDAYPTDVTHVQ